ncbi:hypothetical protein COLSTE_00485 [Collinsella stercoris DSM 13279]|uniref:Uncharacterized protein n=1 Tax=Collinsella stercoris DSM 13279 TaxID=445975 RepID=B6G8U5_9ACTN|nr:hypothetical protein COLSTE_00485 [Collinsella stercoris DSM 13279]
MLLQHSDDRFFESGLFIENHGRNLSTKLRKVCTWLLTIIIRHGGLRTNSCTYTVSHRVTRRRIV